jgi:diguanylate cyclase (GGDEF)-like protein
MHIISAHNRVLAMVGGLGLAAALSIGLAFGYIEGQDEVLNEGFDTDEVLQGLTFDLSDAYEGREESLLAYILTRDPGVLARYQAATRAEAVASREIRHVAVELPEILVALTAVDTASDQWEAIVAEPSLASIGTRAEAYEAEDVPWHRLERVPLAIALLAAEVGSNSASLDVKDESVTGTRTLATMAGVAATFLTVATSLWFVRRYGRELEADIRRSDVLNRFTEATTFAVDDRGVATATLAALALLAKPDSAAVHVLNPSRDRAVPEAAIGPSEGEVLPLKALSGCPGVIRGSTYVTADAAIALSPQCPAYRVDHGTLACVPIAHGETVGTIHLHWDRADAFPLGTRAAVTRITDHAALAIGNRRLLALLEGQAGTDARTGLANSRTFDAALDKKLSTRLGDEQIAILLLDLDRFKDFNDRYGHPAGDDALRAFAAILGSCMRGDDIAARYGGEEFAVLLPGVDTATAVAVAERIRTRTETMAVPVGAGISERITVSIGVAVAPEHATERTALLRIADAALYQAKAAGRNQVATPGIADAKAELAVVA